MHILPASIQDIPALTELINSAYRGEASKKGWTTEADLLKGDLRTDVLTLTELLKNTKAVMLKYVPTDGIIAGCVFLEQRERGLYLGMLTVSPQMQAAGIGKKLLAAAETYAKEKGCKSIFMNVITLRTELIRWYERNGYMQTAERVPMPDNPKFGIPTQPLEFVIMEKIISL
ncbi:GNAT family N-acetyltransferase [Chitinophagaceae bacterium IBVUCB2]|nr:GNAT family N-acetyltransferase [Chitinophagaceae bacterium IBVUCB2]